MQGMDGRPRAGERVRWRLSRRCLTWVLAAALFAPLAQAQETEADQGALQPAEPIQDVVVRGESLRSPVPSKDRSVAGSVIGRDALQGAGARAPEVLRSQPGLSVVETGGQGALATAAIRGATSAQTPVYLAGIRLNDELAGTADLSLVPLWMVERVEIYRGNAPLEADQLGIGGAIFFEPKRVLGPGAAAGATVGSFGTRGLWANASTGNSQSSAWVGMHADHADNDYKFTDDRGTRFDPNDDVVRRRTNADVSTLDLWALGTTQLGKGASAELIINGVRREQGVPGLGLLPTRSARAQLQRSLGAATFRVPCAEDDRCLVTATSTVLMAHVAYRDPDQEIGLGGPRLDVNGSRTEHAVMVRVDATDRVTLTPAVRAAVEQLGLDPQGGNATRANRLFSRAALGASWHVVPKVVLHALGSAECNGTSQGEAHACDRMEPSGRAGVELGDGHASLLANAGRYVRVPELGELYGVSGTVRGNANLVPEHGVSADAGARWAARKNKWVRGAYADLFGFVRWADDLVAYRRSSLGYVRPYNVGRARVAGVEWLGALEPVQFVRLTLSATVMDPRDTTPERTISNSILPFRSRLVLVPSLLLYTSADSLGFDRLSFEARYTYQSSRYADEAGLIIIPSQGSLDLEVVARFWRSRASMRMRLVNVLDEQRFDVIGYALPGRAAYASAEVQW